MGVDRASRRRFIGLAGALIAAAALAACGDAATHTVTVNFVLTDPDTAFYNCHGAGGYSDIGPGTSVTIKNKAGDVVGSASLGDGTPARVGPQLTTCTWRVSVPEVPEGEGFYSAEVASRGQATMSEKDLAANSWQFDLSLGP